MTFQRLFTGYEKAHGTYTIKGVNPVSRKIEGSAITLNEPASDSDYIKHLNGEVGLGIVPLRKNNDCYFGAIDIDAYDVDHKALQEKINKNKIPMILFRSKTGGAHLYIFCQEAIDAQLLREKMVEWAAKLGFGGSEVFPKQTYRINETDIGNWINIPYFNAKETLRYAFDENGNPLSLEDFIKFAESKLVTTAMLKNKPVGIGEDDEKGMFENAPPCLKILYENGGFPEGTRNNGLYNVGVYLRKRYPDNWEDYLSQYNVDMCNPPVALNEVNNLVKSIRKKDYEYMCKQSPIHEHCNKSGCLKAKFGIGDSQSSARAVEIGNITKYQGEPVIWIVEVDQRRIQVSTDDLYSQANFARICMEQLNRLPPAMPKQRWEKYIDERLANMGAEDIIIVPEDASSKGQFSFLVDMYCVGKSQAKSKEEIMANKPWRNEGFIFFTGRSLFEYLDNKRFKYRSEHHVWQMLRERGAEKGFIKIKGRGVNVWKIPEPDMPEDDDLPEKLDFQKEEF